MRPARLAINTEAKPINLNHGEFITLFMHQRHEDGNVYTVQIEIHLDENHRAKVLVPEKFKNKVEFSTFEEHHKL